MSRYQWTSSARVYPHKRQPPTHREYCRCADCAADELERKSVAAPERTTLYKAAGTVLDVQPAGRLRVLANTTNVVDSQRDLMVPGCWAGVVKSGQQPKVTLNHDWGKVAGKATRLWEAMPGSYELPPWHLEQGAGALMADVQLNMDSTIGRDLYSNLKGGFLEQFSVGFEVAGDVDYKGGARHVGRVGDLLEISAVIRGASPQTAVLDAKGFYATKPASPERAEYLEGFYGPPPEEPQRPQRQLSDRFALPSSHGGSAPGVGTAKDVDEMFRQVANECAKRRWREEHPPQPLEVKSERLTLEQLRARGFKL